MGLLAFSTMRPRHVLCFLGGKNQLGELATAAMQLIEDLAPGFEIDADYSQNEPDDRMPAGFEVCRDRVHPRAWSTSDEQAVETHGSVLYVLSPRMDLDNSVDISAAALCLTVHMLGNGAVAAKGESAGVAHGVTRWTQLAKDADTARDQAALARICRLAWAKRPLDGGDILKSVGFHLVGLPEIYIATRLGNVPDLTRIMDRMADEMLQTGAEAVVKRYNATHEPVDFYAEDKFKFNPYGAVRLMRL
jgi:hypothetical protein